jgi:hypothetical protein
MQKLIVVILSALTIVGLTDVAAAGPKQGIGVVSGTVVTGPICPGPARLNQRNCTPHPLQATVKVFAGPAEDDKLVAAIVTDRHGHFRLTLAPGAYRFAPASPGGISIGKAREVTVSAGSTSDIQIVVDTGMR